jgi:hypothetical protein
MRESRLSLHEGSAHYPTGRDLAIVGLPLAGQLRGEMLVVRMRHRLWADGRCLIRGDSELF